MLLRKWLVALAACLTAFVSTSVQGARLESKNSALRIEQKSGTWEMESDGRIVAKGSDLGQRIEVSIEADETLAIVVVDQNPLLYTYALEIQTTETADFSAAASFAAALAKVVTLLPPVGGVVAGTAPHEAETTIRDVKAALNELETALSQIPQLLVASTSRDSATVIQAKQQVASWDIATLTTRLNEGWDTLGTVLGKLDPTATPDQPLLLEILRLQSQRSTADQGLEQLALFASLMAKVDTPLNLGSVSYSASLKSTVTVKIDVNAANAKVAKSLSPTAQNVTVTVEPYSPIRLGYGGAVVYSFVDDPKFTTEEDGDGFRIVKSGGDDDFVGQKVAAMLTLTPRAWERGPLSGELHLGVNPETDELGFFVGGGIRFTDVFSFGAGITFQEVSSLEEGLSLDSPLESPDQLKLDTEFDTGFYIMISATTK